MSSDSDKDLEEEFENLINKNTSLVPGNPLRIKKQKINFVETLKNLNERNFPLKTIKYYNLDEELKRRSDKGTKKEKKC
jgi:hypothetical protein